MEKEENIKRRGRWDEITKERGERAGRKRTGNGNKAAEAKKREKGIAG